MFDTCVRTILLVSGRRHAIAMLDRPPSTSVTRTTRVRKPGPSGRADYDCASHWVAAAVAVAAPPVVLVAVTVTAGVPLPPVHVANVVVAFPVVWSALATVHVQPGAVTV